MERNVHELEELKWSSNWWRIKKKVSEAFTDLITKIGENMSLRRLAVVVSKDGLCSNL